MVGLFGLEPKTKGFIILCSNQLPREPDTGTGIIHNRCIVYNTGENKSDILKAYKVKKPSF